MPHALPDLGYSGDSLAPFLSAGTLDCHHDGHHRIHVESLNRLIAGTDLASSSLLQLLKRASGATLNHAGQHFNHSFYWKCIAPNDGSSPRGALAQAIERDYGSMEKLEEAFVRTSNGLFGSGWCWLVLLGRRLRISATKDAGCPAALGETPILACDLWEHAYYLDYRQAREDYLRSFWRSVDWSFCGRCHDRPEGIEAEILGA